MKSRKTASPPWGWDSSGIRVLADNLVNPLTAECILLGKVRETQAIPVVTTDIRIPTGVRDGARAQRAPLPTRDCLEGLDAVLRQQAGLATLAGIAHKRTKFDVDALDVLDVQSRDSAVTGTRLEMAKGRQVHVETHCVIHGTYNSKRPEMSGES